MSFDRDSYLAWEAPTQVSLPTYTEEEALKIRHDWLESRRFADNEGEEIPELVRWIRPGDWQTISDCLTDAGFANKVAPSLNGIIFDNAVGDPSASAPDLAQLWRCNAMYTFDAAGIGDMTREQYMVMYEYYSSYYLDCLNAHGITLDRSAVPSEDTWVGQVMSGHAPPWLPNDTSTWPQEAKAAAMRIGDDVLDQQCPAEPPPSAFYGQ